MKDEIQREIDCINNSYRMPIPKYLYFSSKDWNGFKKCSTRNKKNQFAKHINYRAESEKLKDNHILSDLRKYSYDFLHRIV